MADKAILQRLTVNTAIPTPLFLQLSAGLRKQILDGRLTEGMSLPTVQSLARHCRMSQATVMRAINELAAEGMIVTRRGARSVVAARRAASTEVLVGYLTHAPTAQDISFFNQLLDGLREGYREPERRFLTTYLDAMPGHGAELLRVCQVASADGIVAYRPRGVTVTVLQEVAPQMPVVSLFYPVPGVPADCVATDPAPVLRELLRDRIAQGKKRFCYVGAVGHFLEEPEGSPYGNIYRATVETVKAAGLEFTEINLPASGGNEADWAQAGRDIPDGTVLVAGHPRLALACEGARPRLDMISYTEYRVTAERAAGRVTMLYLGLETVGVAAAELLRSRVQSGNTLPARTVTLTPKIMQPPVKAG